MLVLMYTSIIVSGIRKLLLF